MAPRLRSLPSRVQPLAPRVGKYTPTAQGTLRAKRDHAPWRAWYSTKAWQELRQKVFERDAYVCQRTGVICAGIYPAGDSPTANHKIPHRGDPALFWDEDNVETVTKEIHDSTIQAEEAKAFQRGDWG